MSDTDDIMQGFVIAIFSLAGLSAISYCVRIKLRQQHHMKKSASMEELSSVDTSDPTQTQDEERYALPPILVTRV